MLNGLFKSLFIFYDCQNVWYACRTQFVYWQMKLCGFEFALLMQFYSLSKRPTRRDLDRSIERSDSRMWKRTASRSTLFKLQLCTPPPPLMSLSCDAKALWRCSKCSICSRPSNTNLKAFYQTDELRIFIRPSLMRLHILKFAYSCKFVLNLERSRRTYIHIVYFLIWLLLIFLLSINS